MAKKTIKQEKPQPKEQSHDKLTVLLSHYQNWTSDNDIRRTREDGWDDITDAYWGKLPEEWPYDSRVVDPRIRTSIIDKDARLINARLRGRLVPRESGDILGARINNAILDFQWDNATWGGTMENKLLISSQDSRMYGSKFARITWMIKKDEEGNTIFEGNEYEPLDLRDCGIDYASKSIKDAKWFQFREWVYLEDLQAHNETASPDSKFENIDKILGDIRERKSLRGGGDRRQNRYISRIKELKGLQDRLGQDMAFPIIELVTEYRRDRWITFAPSHGVILRDIKNPYKHNKIPIVQLKYYPLQDDPIGESEVEPVLSLWRAIQAVLCGYLDEMNIKMRPPLKIIEGQARIETIVYGPEAQWLVNSQNAVEEMRSDSSGIINFFQSSYQALVSAFNTAMGDLSQGTSAVDPFSNNKTATEVKQVAKQQNVRDERNQLILSQFIQDIMGMWLSNNQQFLFSDPTKQEMILKIVGNEQFEYFQRMGLDQMEVSDDSMQDIAEIISMQDGNMSDMDISQLLDSALEPKYPVKVKGKVKPKMTVGEMGNTVDLIVTPEDLNGTYDYIPDVKSMASGADAEMQNARMRAIDMSTNPAIVQQLLQEGWKPKLKEQLVSVYEDLGNKDAERFFEKVQAEPQQPAMAQVPGAMGPQAPGMPTPPPVEGMPPMPMVE